MNKIIGLILLLSGCSLSSELELPKLDLPNFWNKSEMPNKQIKQEELYWWGNFKDPKLNYLVDMALKSSTDILLAMNNIVKAQAALGLTNAERLPEINLQIGANRAVSSKEENTTITTKPISTFGINTVLNYQLDLWGKVASSNKAAKANLLAMEETTETVKLTITSEVTKAYFNLLSLNKKITLTNKLIATNQAIYSINKKQLKTGSIDAEPLHQLEASFIEAEQQLPILKQQFKEQENALAILLGKNPAMLLEEKFKLADDITSLPIPPVTPNILPAKLLTQRPDIKASEQQLIAANAEIAVARAEYFPEISLNALLGIGSNNIDKLFKGNSWQFGSNIAGRLFNHGRISSNIKLTEANKKDYLINYENTIKNAFRDVFNAMSLQRTTEENFNIAKRNEKALAASKNIHNNRYKVGYANYIHVLEAEQKLLISQITSINYYQSRLNASVDLFKALGGNWNDNKNIMGIIVK
jgi:multidrug efflux system outer membrane protein